MRRLLIISILVLLMAPVIKFNLFYGKVIYSKYWWQSKIIRGNNEYPAMVGAFVKEGDIIEVGKYAAVQIRFVDNSILNITENSRVKISRGKFYKHRQVETRDIAIDVDEGEIYMDITKRKGALTIQEKSLVIGVRGTMIYLNTREDSSQMAVMDGVVEVKSKVTGDTFVVNEGYVVEVEKEEVKVRKDEEFVRTKKEAYKKYQREFASFAPPDITFSKMTTPPFTNQPVALFDGVVSKPALLMVNGDTVELDGRYFSFEKRLVPGENVFYFVAVDTSNLAGELKYKIVYDNDTPKLKINRIKKKRKYFILQGYVADKTSGVYSLRINGQPVDFNKRGFFRVDLKQSTALIEVEDIAGNVLKKQVDLEK